MSLTIAGTEDPRDKLLNLTLHPMKKNKWTSLCAMSPLHFSPLCIVFLHLFSPMVPYSYHSLPYSAEKENSTQTSLHKKIKICIL